MQCAHMITHTIATTITACIQQNQDTSFCLNCHTGPMKEYEQVHRVLAAHSFMLHDGSISAALKAFSISCTTLGIKPPRDPRSFVARWGRQWLANQHVSGTASNSGRKPKLSTQNAELLVADLMNWAGFDLAGPFSSLDELKQKSPRAKAILEAAKAATSTVIRHLKRIEPKLAYKKLTVKQKLTSKQKAARLRVAQHHVTVSDNTLSRVVFVDAKTMYMTIKKRCGWVRLDDELPFETIRPYSKKNPITLRYYIGVCGRAGGVFLTFYTGTTGMTADRHPSNPYLVRSASVQLRRLASYCCCNGTPDGCAPAAGAAAGLAWQQPHHLKVLVLGSSC